VKWYDTDNNRRSTDTFLTVNNYIKVMSRTGKQMFSTACGKHNTGNDKAWNMY